MVESFFRDSLTEDSQSAKKADNMKKENRWHCSFYIEGYLRTSHVIIDN